MKSHIAAILAVTSVLVISGSIAFAWRIAPTEEVLPCDGKEHNDIESKKDEWREFETYHGSGAATRSEDKVIADLVDERAKGYACDDCPSAFGVACEKEAGSDYTGFDWLPDEGENYWRWKVENLTVWVKCHTCD